jgi:large subunit ribosomal protein L38e
MPIEIKDRGEAIKISERAKECKVKRLEKEGVAKVKIRTKRYLYTIKVPLDEVNDFLKELKCPEIKEI